MPQRTLTLLLVAGLAAGCTLKAPLTGVHAKGHPQATPAPTGPGPIAGDPLAPAAPVAGVVANGGSSLNGNNGGGLIANNSGSLVGTVKAPAALLGIGLTGNTSVTLIANNGAGLGMAMPYAATGTRAAYGLLGLPEQVPLPNVLVALLDAKNQPILGTDGRPLVATTDDQGRYAFQAILPARNLVLSVDLPDQKGRLQALASRAAKGTRRADMDLISTLTTTYILDQYVKGQADPLATLEKLPADVELTTRTKAAAAYTGSVPLPTALTPPLIATTVATLRQQSPAFDTQMDAVKKLLIAAGQSDLGAGRAGTEVTIGWVSGLALASDGTLYIASPRDNRVWRLASDGRLYTAIGAGTPAKGSLDGLAAPTAGLAYPVQIGFDASNRLLVLENAAADPGNNDPAPITRLSALQADGTLKDLWPGMGSALAFWPRANGDVWVLVASPSSNNPPAALWAVSAGAAPRLLHTYTAQQTDQLVNAHSAGVDGAGALYLSSQLPDATGNLPYGALRIDPNSFAAQAFGPTIDPLSGHVLVDARGDLLAFDTTTTPHARLTLPGSTAATVSNGWPANAGDVTAFQAAPGGGLYAALNDGVYQWVNGSATRVVGSSASPGAKAGDLALANPGVPAVGADGTLYVPDAQLMKLLAVPIAGPSSVLADFTPAAVGPWIVRQDAAGSFYLTSSRTLGQTLQKVVAGGKPQQLFACSPDEVIDDIVVTANGTLYLSVSNQQPGITTKLERLLPGQPAAVIAELGAGSALALAPDGSLFVAGNGTLARWSAANGLKAIKTDARFASPGNNPANPALETNAYLAADASGRLYLTDASANTLTRFDPASGSFVVIAGPGGKAFTGSGVNDSLLAPCGPVFDAQGNLYVSDNGHKQIKRLPAAQL